MPKTIPKPNGQSSNLAPVCSNPLLVIAIFAATLVLTPTQHTCAENSFDDYNCNFAVNQVFNIGSTAERKRNFAALKIFEFKRNTRIKKIQLDSGVYEAVVDLIAASTLDISIDEDVASDLKKARLARPGVVQGTDFLSWIESLFKNCDSFPKPVLMCLNGKLRLTSSSNLVNYKQATDQTSFHGDRSGRNIRTVHYLDNLRVTLVSPPKTWAEFRTLVESVSGSLILQFGLTPKPEEKISIKSGRYWLRDLLTATLKQFPKNNMTFFTKSKVICVESSTPKKLALPKATPRLHFYPVGTTADRATQTKAIERFKTLKFTCNFVDTSLVDSLEFFGFLLGIHKLVDIKVSERMLDKVGKTTNKITLIESQQPVTKLLSRYLAKTTDVFIWFEDTAMRIGDSSEFAQHLRFCDQTQFQTNLSQADQKVFQKLDQIRLNLTMRNEHATTALTVITQATGQKIHISETAKRHCKTLDFEGKATTLRDHLQISLQRASDQLFFEIRNGIVVIDKFKN